MPRRARCGVRRCGLVAVVAVAASLLIAGPAGADAASAGAAPSDTAPSDTAPSDTAPAELAPAELAPVELAQVELAQVELAQVELAPVELAPAELAPAAASPADPAPTGPAPTDVTPAAVSPAAVSPLAVAPGGLVVDLTFPAERGGRYSDDYSAPRSSGRTHCATDILGAKHSRVFATVGGTITFMPTTKPSYGYMVSLQGDDGRRYSYVHLNDDTPGTNDDAAGPHLAYAPGLAKGARVDRGQLLGFMGDSGSAKGTPHLHFEIHDPAYQNGPCETGGINRINPYRSLRQAEAEGDYASGTAGGGAGVGPPGVQARSIDDACPSGRVPGSAFADVGPTHRTGVDCLAWWRVATGTSGTTFAPGASINRAQLATFVANLAQASGSALPATGTDHFDDDDGSVHEGNINRVAAAGIMGSATRSFSPDLAVTRGSMATALARTYRYDARVALQAGPNAFTDDAGNTHEGDIDAVAANGLAVGYVDGTFRPLEPVTREQMATFFSRLLDLLVDGGHATPPA